MKIKCTSGMFTLRVGTVKNI